MRRHVDVAAWIFIAVGVFTLLVPIVGFNLLVLAIPIGFGLRKRCDGWRIGALGMAFLCVCASVASLLLPVGNGGYTTPGLSQDVAWGSLSVLGAASAASGWVAWLLTRTPVLRAFGNA